MGASLPYTFHYDLFSVQMTPADIKNIREIAERDDVLELLAKSLAPSIYGHNHIKKALVLQLLVSRSLPRRIVRNPPFLLCLSLIEFYSTG